MIIGLVGFIGSGKNTVAEILENKHGFVKESFAKSVKDAISVIFSWDRAMLEGDTSESRAWREQPDPWWSEKLGREFSPRLALQLMGTEAGRNVFHPDMWILSLLRRVDPNKNYVLADVRFPNEIKMIRDSGGMIIRVRRGPEPEWYDDALLVNSKKNLYLMAEKWPDVHYSEWAWIGSGIDIVLDNNGGLDQLDRRVDQLIDSVYNYGVEAVEVQNENF